ncbi:tyrosine-type recombinase/integrase [Glutamicibacter soli]|uniref:Tyrosine-type recombinase/integrase n=1 Tax=Glutamicibacter soli TaxID=453836 RepID=A0A6L9GBP7_9MICC|nr:tyrosine-type recombinase/integrase [Glutamicibacter soli]NAZ17930.1 tyrosine-type recombinase/integrase [Glutamicibacter soli]
MNSFPALLQAFFTDKLIAERQASANTLAAYRDTFVLLLRYLDEVEGHRPETITFEICNARVIASFLNHLETERGNSVSTRNARLAAIRSFYRYASYREPAQASRIAEVLSIGTKRRTNHLVEYLDHDEVLALLAAPDQTRWHGRRDHIMLFTAIHTGLRVSELAGLNACDVHVRPTGSYVQCVGKGRKTRRTPLASPTQTMLDRWISECALAGQQPVFGTVTGHRLSRDAIAKILRVHLQVAALKCPSLVGKNITPHSLRHTCAMLLLQAGVDINVIAMWLGHQSPETTQVYLHADLRAKEEALAKIALEPGPAPDRYHADGELMGFLAQL